LELSPGHQLRLAKVTVDGLFPVEHPLLKILSRKKLIKNNFLIVSSLKAIRYICQVKNKGFSKKGCIV